MIFSRSKADIVSFERGFLIIIMWGFSVIVYIYIYICLFHTHMVYCYIMTNIIINTHNNNNEIPEVVLIQNYILEL